jgi:hypothetical protein
MAIIIGHDAVEEEKKGITIHIYKNSIPHSKM